MRIACCAILLLVVGCSKSSDFATSEVTGTVTVAGQPLNDPKQETQIFFFPLPSSDKAIQSGKRGWAFVGTDGTFKISTYGEKDGAVIGKHRVAFSSNNVTPFDSKYLSAETSGLTFEVKPGANKADFNLDAAKK